MWDRLPARELAVVSRQLTVINPRAVDVNDIASFCEMLFRRSQSLRKTPVLVISNHLMLRDAFLVGLCDQLHQTLRDQGNNSNLRIDWMCGGDRLWSVFSDQWARIRASRIIKQLDVTNRDLTQIQITSTIGRTSADLPNLVLGICAADAELPAWAYQIPLGSTKQPLDLQFS